MIQTVEAVIDEEGNVAYSSPCIFLRRGARSSHLEERQVAARQSARC